MHIQTSKIKISCPDGCNGIVRHKCFWMYKAAWILVDLYTGSDKFSVIWLSGNMNDKLVPFIRSYDSYIDSAFSCKRKSRYKTFINDKVRSIDIQIFFCAVNYLQIYVFSDIFGVKRRIWIRLYITVARNIAFFIFPRVKFCKIFRFFCT